jgi:hypothetical protein
VAGIVTFSRSGRLSNRDLPPAVKNFLKVVFVAPLFTLAVIVILSVGVIIDLCRPGGRPPPKDFED